MSGLPADISARIETALASGDKGAAASLAGAVAAAIAKGEATGFDDDLVALKRLAGGDLGKRAPLTKAAPVEDIPAHLQARRDTIMRKMMRHASTPAEAEAAEREGKALVAEVAADAGIRASQALPQRMGLAR